MMDKGNFFSGDDITEGGDIGHAIEVLKKSDQDQHAVIGERSADHIALSRLSSKNLPTLGRSSSVGDLNVSVAESSEDAFSRRRMLHRFYSFGDLNNFSGLEVGHQNCGRSFNSEVFNDKNIVVSCSNVKPAFDVNGKFQYYSRIELEDLSFVRCGLAHNHDSGDNVIKLKAKDVEVKQYCLPETYHYNLENPTPEESSMKRVEHWISNIDIHGDLIVEEQEESCADVSIEDSQSGVDTLKPDARSIRAMDVVYNCISSLTSASLSTQMTNLGLVTVPILSSFVSLRSLNLSGNAIVRLTPGSLPKGLHMLNLSRNNISSIEGFRDLSHLRVLDLSYNRIAKIGHGLSSCSSLKELYLSCNKIREVEGLHRLLKLNSIDLRFNKISSLEGLGQLAANYNSLQAINIEGNPAQKNVRDGQLKKFLAGLLPNLVHYNEQAITYFDRGTKTEHKLPRRRSLGSGLHKLASNHGEKSGADRTSTKLIKDQNLCMQLPHASSKLTDRHLDAEENLFSDDLRRSQSTKHFGALSHLNFKESKQFHRK